jgi:hypothetical protein
VGRTIACLRWTYRFLTGESLRVTDSGHLARDLQSEFGITHSQLAFLMPLLRADGLDVSTLTSTGGSSSAPRLGAALIAASEP